MQSSSNILTGNFQKSWFDGFDPRFFAILICALLVESLVVIMMTRQPVEVYSEKEIARLQEHFANFVLGEPAKNAADNRIAASGEQGGSEADGAEEDVAAPEAEGNANEASGESEGESSGASRQAARTMAASARREAMTREVSNKGLLRMLTGTGSAATGGTVSDLLGSGGSSGSANLDEVLASAGGLKTGGTAGLGGKGSAQGGAARGGRSGGKASINDLVSDLGGARSQSMERKGALAVEAPTGVEGRGQRSTNRSPQEIQRVILGHIKAIQYCYERELKRNPELKGKVTVRITVHPDGHVSEVTILNSTLNNERVERCIRSRIANWKDFKPIEPSEGTVTFRQSFTFGY